MKYVPARFPRRLMAGAALVLLQACAAALPGTDAPAWPERVVALEQMRPLERLRVAIPKHGRGDRIGGGTVVLRLLVDAEGAVRRVAQVEGSGDASIDGAAARAMRASRFAPFRVDGVAVPVTVLARMDFRAPPVLPGAAPGATVWP